MPLAIVQAASYIRNRAPRCSVSQYLRDFRKNDLLLTVGFLGFPLVVQVFSGEGPAPGTFPSVELQ
jgi:hypothetical protein